MQFVDVAVVVKDANASARWWKDVVGFDVWREGDHFVVVGPKGATVGLHLCQMEPLEPGNTGIGFSIPDCKAEEARLRAKGARITMETQTAPWGTYFMFADPDGNEFYVGEEPGFRSFAPGAAAARKGRAGKSASRRAPAKKAAAKKPATKKAAKKGATRKAAGKTAPAKKSAAKKAPARKATKARR